MKYSFVSTIFIVCAIILTFSGCRKETLREENGNVITSSELHCYNGTLDGDETGVDCGGSNCEPCNEVAIPCTIANNTLIVNSTSYSITSINSNVSGGDYVITAVSGTKNITIKVLDPPTTATSYELDYPTTSVGNAVISITNLPSAVSNYIYTSGDLYFNASGSGYKVVLCGGAYWDTFGSGHNVELNIIVP